MINGGLSSKFVSPVMIVGPVATLEAADGADKSRMVLLDMIVLSSGKLSTKVVLDDERVCGGGTT